MTRIPDLKQEIKKRNAEIGALTKQIESRFEEATDWKHMVIKKPFQSLAISVGMGFLLFKIARPVIRASASGAGHLSKDLIKTGMLAAISGMVNQKSRKMV